MAGVTSTALVTEAVSFLNGAHLNPRGHLSNLFRRWHQTLSSTSTMASSGATAGQSSPSLSSLVLSELGVDRLDKDELSRALSNTWTSLDSQSVGGASITVSDVLKQCRSEFT